MQTFHRSPSARFVRFGLIGIIVSLATVLARPMRGAEATGNQWGVLIGVQAYEKVIPLQFTVKDVQTIAETLSTYGGYQMRHLLQVTDDASESDQVPKAETLKTHLPEWLSGPKEEDSLLVYFSGHGFQAEDGKMYLAPLDFDPENPEQTGLSVDWLRQEIEKCKAGFKLLIIDSCHAGSEDDAETLDGSTTSDAIGNAFKTTAGVVTLASCKSEEKSQLWFGKQRSLYSYWLNEGLKGHADRDSDGRVDIDELHRYVDRRVRHTAVVRFGRPQTPVRIIGPRVVGVPSIVRLRPQPMRRLLSNMAEHLANLLEEHKLEKVGVLEFSDDSQLQEVLGGNFGLIGKYCGDEVERQLTVLSQDADFRIVDRNRLRQALQAQGGFRLTDLASPDRMDNLSQQAGDMQVIALGSIRGRQGPILRLQCELKETTTGDLIGITGGTAQMSEDEWAMLGESVMVQPEDRVPVLTSVRRNDADAEAEVPATVIDRLDERAQQTHPLADPQFTQKYNVKIKVGGKTLEPVFNGNDCVVGLNKGDNYRIRLENTSGELVLVRVLVDGLDTTLKVAEKGLSTELWGTPVANLDEAGHRFLDPNGEEVRGRAPAWEVYGFTTKTGPKGKVRLFEVVDAAASLAARQGFTEQVGMITVAFYSPRRGRAIGTAAGAEQEIEICRREGPRPGKLLSVVHIRYVEPEALNALR
ncbi:MAG: caspase family protein [Pirellulaceae bacterium]